MPNLLNQHKWKLYPIFALIILASVAIYAFTAPTVEIILLVAPLPLAAIIFGFVKLMFKIISESKLAKFIYYFFMIVITVGFLIFVFTLIADTESFSPMAMGGVMGAMGGVVASSHRFVED